MKEEKYIVVFKAGQVEVVYAFSKQEARILAQAEQIKKGNDYKVDRVYHELELKPPMTLFNLFRVRIV